MLTSSRAERDLIAGYEPGVNSYVVKPVGFGEHGAVRHIGLFRAVVDEPPPDRPGNGPTEGPVVELF
jgi:DNA-binding response OmpR family regulator